MQNMQYSFLNNNEKSGFQLPELCKKIAGNFNGRDVDEFEIYVSRSVQNEIEVFNSKINTLSFSDSTGIGIRVFRGGCVGYAYTSSIREKEIIDCIEKAICNSKITSKDELNSLPRESEFRYQTPYILPEDLFKENFLEFGIDKKIELTKELEVLVKKKDRRVTGVDNLLYNDDLSEVAIFNSLGFEGSYKTAACVVYVSVISKENKDVSTGDFFGYARSPGDLDLEEIAENAVNRSVLILGGQKIKSRRAKVILDPLVACQFLGVIAIGLTADRVQKGKSLFKDRIGERFFSIDLDIVDDGTMPSGMATRPFDSEGVPKGRTLIFEKGILKTFLYNSYTARKDNTKSTGNAVRSSYKSPPTVGLSNLYIVPSVDERATLEGLLEVSQDGFYVVDIMGLHSGTNPVSGEISVGAKGMWVEGGKFRFPVREVTIATDILSLCKNIERIGNDLKFIISGGYIGSPSLVVNDIMISGI